MGQSPQNSPHHLRCAVRGFLGLTFSWLCVLDIRQEQNAIVVRHGLCNDDDSTH